MVALTVFAPLPLLPARAGTPIQAWSDNATNAKCGRAASDAPAPQLEADLPEPRPSEFVSAGYEARVRAGPGPGNKSVLFNAMIAPFALGPMPLSSFIWFQGEADSGSASYYACAQPAMIESWRAYFANPSAFFGFVVLEPWTGGASDLPEFRDAQLGSLALPYTGYAIGTDIGDPTGPFGSVHPRCVRRARGGRLALYERPAVLPRAQQQEARRAAPRQRGAERAVRLARALPGSQRDLLHRHSLGH